MKKGASGNYCRVVRLALMSAGVIGILSACGGGSSSSVTPTAPAAGGGAPAGSTFNPSSVQVTPVAVPKNTAADTQTLAVDGFGAVYFGSMPTIVPGFCLYVNAAGDMCSGPSQGLYRYTAGTFTMTLPRGPYFGSSNGITCNGVPIPGANCSQGNVSAINATGFSSVIWASDYAADAGFISVSELQWGGAGGTATTPPAPYNQNFPSNQNATEIVSIQAAAGGQIWLGGGGPGPGLYPATVPATCDNSPYSCDLFFVANGPNGNVWAMTRTYSCPTCLPTGSAFFEFTPSGMLVKTYTTSDVAVRIAATANDIWFTDYAHDAIGTINANGQITEYPVPTANAGPYGITVAADGSVWFAEYTASKVGRIDSTGHINEFAVPFQPFSVAATPPGCATNTIWVGSLGQNLAEITPGT